MKFRISPRRSWHAAMNCCNVWRMAPKSQTLQPRARLPCKRARTPETLNEAPDHTRINGIVDSGNYINVAGIESNLALLWRRYHDIAANELTPVHVIAEGIHDGENSTVMGDIKQSTAATPESSNPTRPFRIHASLKERTTCSRSGDWCFPHSA